MRPLVIANWKMNLKPSQSAALALEMKKALKNENDKDVAICPSFTALAGVSKSLAKTKISLGAQDVFWQESGAYTGGESVGNLKEFGCEFIIVGHSERRKNFGETNEMINKKISVCLDNGLVPVLCIGESAQERHEGKADHVLWKQLNECLKGIELMPGEKLAIAYEPIWAIGTGETITAHEADKTFGLIHQHLLDLWPLTITSNNVRILYGGSVTGETAAELSKISKIKGFLVGGASLDVSEFSKIIKNTL